MKKELLYVGMDVHSWEIHIAVAEVGRNVEVRHYGTISGDFHAVEKAMSRLGHPKKELKVCYEAGPHGFDSVADHGSLTPSGLSLRSSLSRLPPVGSAVLARRLRQLGIDLHGGGALKDAEGERREGEDRPP
ncbi:MAG: hypothetical protein ACR2OZ_09420 [Verrucomicrobiales bacterium]